MISKYIEEISNHPLAIYAIFCSLGLLLGYLFERIIFRRIFRFTYKTKWQADYLIVMSLRKLSSVWFGLLGFYLGFIFFPPTQPTYKYISNVLFVILVLLVTISLTRLAIGIEKYYSKKNEGAFFKSSILANTTRVILYSIALIIIFEFSGISITPIITALGVGGLAVALALQDTLTNLFSGIQIIITKQVKPGDYIKLTTGEEGIVTDSNWRFTKLRTIFDYFVIIPNAKLASTIIKNYNLPKADLFITLKVGVVYDNDLDKVEAVTIQTANKVLSEYYKGIDTYFPPFMRFFSFDEFRVSFYVYLRVFKFLDQFELKHIFIRELHNAYRREGIEIAFPVKYIRFDNADTE